MTSCSCESEFSVLLLHWIGLHWTGGQDSSNK